MRRSAATVWDVLVVGGGPAGCRGRVLARATPGTGCSSSRRSASPARRPAATASRRGPSASSTTWASRPQLVGFLRYDGLRSIAHGVTLELEWPEHPDFPDYGYVVRRRDLDEMVADAAAERGRRRCGPGAEAVEPLVEDGLVVGAVDRRATTASTEAVRARYVVVADGANSRFGRALGHRARPHYPLGMAVRGYFTSPFHDEPWIESHLDLRDRDGNHLPGYGWIFPVGDGTVNVGVGLLSTFPGWKDVNTTHADGGVRARPRPRAGASRPRPSCGPPTGGQAADRRIGHARRSGPTWLVVGDAAGSVNPFNGEGISLAYETGPARGRRGRRGARAPATASRCRRYPQRLDEVYGLYFKVARAFVRAIGNPAVMRELDPRRDAAAARSWSGCCGSWPTCCAPTSSARPRPPTRWSPPSSPSRPSRAELRSRRRRRAERAQPLASERTAASRVSRLAGSERISRRRR